MATPRESWKFMARNCFKSCQSPCPPKPNQTSPGVTLPLEQSESPMAKRSQNVMCDDRECRRPAKYGTVDKRTSSKCEGEMAMPSVFLDNVMDLANTLAGIMIVCGLDKSRAMHTIEVNVSALLHYDQVFDTPTVKPKRRIRKKEVLADLMRQCYMDFAEAKLSYKMIKRGFKAFHYNLKTNGNGNGNGNGGKHKECLQGPKRFDYIYAHAAKKTFQDVIAAKTLTYEQHHHFDNKIKELYMQFVQRLKQRNSILENRNCLVGIGECNYPVELQKESKHFCPACCVAKRKARCHPKKASFTPVSSLHTSRISWASHSGLYAITPISSLHMSTLSGRPHHDISEQSVSIEDISDMTDTYHHHNVEVEEEFDEYGTDNMFV